MKLRTRVFFGGALVAIILGSFTFLRRAPDPIVAGRLASAWALDLLSADYQVRGEARTALLSLGEVAVPQLRELLRKTAPPWQPLANRFGDSLPFLSSNGPEPALCRQRGAEMIGLLGAKGSDAVPDLVDSLGYAQAATDAERALIRVGNAAISGLLVGLRARNTEVRTRCARLLKEYVACDDRIVSSLIRTLGDSHPAVRKEAVLTLGRAPSSTPNILAAVLNATKDEVAEVRAAAFDSVGRSGAKSRPVLDALHAGLRDPFPIVRLESAKAYWALTGDCDAVVPVLSGVLPTQEGWQAAYALGSIGPAAAPAVPALIEVLKREKVPRAFRTPPSSSFALGQIQEPAIPALEQVLSHPEPAVRIAAVLALGFMGEHARSAIPKLRKLLKDPELEIRHVTAITLASAGADREILLPSLSDCLHAEDIYMRSTAAALLRKLVPEQEWTVLPE